jgi:hypothetical protein
MDLEATRCGSISLLDNGYWRRDCGGCSWLREIRERASPLATRTHGLQVARLLLASGTTVVAASTSWLGAPSGSGSSSWYQATGSSS